MLFKLALQHGRHTRFHDKALRMLNGGAERRNFVERLHVAVVIDRPVGANDANVAVAARPEIVEDSGANGALDQGDGLFFIQIPAPGTFKDRHGGETATAHGGVGQFAGTAVRVNLVHVRTLDVAASEHEGRADVALVVVEEAFEVGAGRDDAALFAVLLQAQEIQIAAHHVGGFFRVGGRSGAAAVNVGRQQVNLFAILLGDFGAPRGAGIRAEHDAPRKGQSGNGGPRLSGVREVVDNATFGGKIFNDTVAVQIFERKTRWGLV